MSRMNVIANEQTELVYVPLSKLKRSPKNVRQMPHTKADIFALAASIAAIGMIQNPVIEPEIGPGGKPTGHYLVNAGEGRRLAQLLRAKRKEIKTDELVRCVLDIAHNGTEISLAENAIRSDMHPADQYEAFAKLHNEHGFSTEDIAGRFGVTAAVNRAATQRLGVGPSSARLINFREAAPCIERVVMDGAEPGLHQLESGHKQLDGLVNPARDAEGRGEVSATQERKNVARAERDLTPLQGGPVQVDGLGDPASLEVVYGEVIAALERIRVVRTERGPAPPQSGQVQLDGLGDPAGDAVGGGEDVATQERVGMVGTELGPALLQCGPEQVDGLGDAVGIDVGGGELVATPERIGVVGTERGLVP